MRYLYLDDSGKVDSRHPSKAVVFAGFSVAHDRWHSFVRQVTGAKARFIPKRGHPARWELKGADLLTANAWNRSCNRGLCLEVADILRRNDCRLFYKGFVKDHAPRPLQEAWAVPLCFQGLAREFASELESLDSQGAMICDWSNYSLDQHVSNRVQAYVLRKQLLRISGGVTYGSSLSLATIQVADLLAYALRTAVEGAPHHMEFLARLAALRPAHSRETRAQGIPFPLEGMLF